jgi:hypothetical protein
VKRKKRRKTKQQLNTQNCQTTQYIPFSAETMATQKTVPQSGINSHPFSKRLISFDAIEIQKELGKGSYGRVCLGLWNGAPVALKFCKEKEGVDEFWKEANLMMYKTPPTTEELKIENETLNYSNN